MKTALAILFSMGLSSIAFSQTEEADRILLQTWLTQHRQTAAAAEASASFVRDQLATLQGKLDYYADPTKSKVRSRADLREHFGDLGDPVREATARIYHVKETLDSLALSFGGSVPPNKPTMIRMLPNDTYECDSAPVDLPTLKSKLNRTGSLDPNAAVNITFPPTASATALAAVVACCQDARIRYIWFNQEE